MGDNLNDMRYTSSPEGATLPAIIEFLGYNLLSGVNGIGVQLAARGQASV